jgi:mitogen-activated protein kinase kinase
MAAVVSPIRKKRNFKALQLKPPVPAEPQVESVQPIPMRQAPVPGGKKRPPPMTLKPTKVPSSGAGAVSAIEQETPHMLTVASNGPGSAPTTASASTRRNTYHATLSSTLANLDMNTEIKFDLRNEDLKDLQELGQGNGGSVKKVEHTPTGTIMAKKVYIPPPPRGPVFLTLGVCRRSC